MCFLFNKFEMGLDQTIHYMNQNKKYPGIWHRLHVFININYGNSTLAISIIILEWF